MAHNVKHKQALMTASCILLGTFLWGQAAQNPAKVNVSSNTDGPASAGTEARPTGRDSSGRAHDDEFVIGVEDLLAVNVWKEPEISRVVPVRSDGKISLPLAGEVKASGETPKQLEMEIANKLHNYISEPDVTVIVEEIKSQKFNILGQVARPGSYLLKNSMTVLDAIAEAGGFRDFAKQKSIYILRQNFGGGESRIPFNYKDVIKGKNTVQNVTLQPRDTVVIP